MNKKLAIVLAVLALVLATVACGGGGSVPTRRPLNLYPTATPNATQTPLVIVWTSTPGATPTPNVVVVEITPTPASGRVCVSASVAVYLRPSPSDDNYPILSLPNGSQLVDLGGRNGNWLFVQYKESQGWVNGAYVTGC